MPGPRFVEVAVDAPGVAGGRFFTYALSGRARRRRSPARPSSSSSATAARSGSWSAEAGAPTGDREARHRARPHRWAAARRARAAARSTTSPSTTSRRRGTSLGRCCRPACSSGSSSWRSRSRRRRSADGRRPTAGRQAADARPGATRPDALVAAVREASEAEGGTRGTRRRAAPDGEPGDAPALRSGRSRRTACWRSSGASCRMRRRPRQVRWARLTDGRDARRPPLLAAGGRSGWSGARPAPARAPRRPGYPRPRSGVAAARLGRAHTARPR